MWRGVETTSLEPAARRPDPQDPMKALFLASALALAGLLPATTANAGPDPLGCLEPAPAAADIDAAGTFTQTGITTLDVRMIGGVTILEQTSFGVVDGTLDGTFEDSLHVVIFPNGTFASSFRLMLDCELDGATGQVTMKAADIGRLVDPTTGEFAGVAGILEAAGDLAGLGGAFRIQGTVDLTTGLSTYSYEGTLRQGS